MASEGETAGIDKPKDATEEEKETEDAEEAVAQAEAKFASATTPENMKIAKAELDEAEARLTEFSQTTRQQETEYNLFKAEAEKRQATQKQIDDIDNPYAIKKNLFTDSWLSNFLQHLSKEFCKIKVQQILQKE